MTTQIKQLTSIVNVSEMLHHVIPYFQPIVCAEDQSVWGYEVLGRVKTSSGVKSLGPFFHNSHISQNIKMQVDEHIRQLALRAFENNGKPFYLFININPDWLKQNWEKRNIDWLTKSSINPEYLVLEITESDISVNDKELKEMIQFYRSLGCKVAIDDVGKGFSNLDRIASLNPDILKIDLSLIKKSIHSRSFQDVLRSLSLLAQKMGASLLFEGIEKKDELQNAWKNGGRFYQGYLLSYPIPEFLPSSDNNFKKEIETLVDQMMSEELKVWSNQVMFENTLNNRLSHTLSKISALSNPNEYLLQFIPFITDFCFRVYLCNDKGNQQSSNFILNKVGTWVKQSGYKNKNWSWRPYFIYNIAKMQFEGKGVLSEPYIDLENNQEIRTFSYPVHRGMYLFMDIIHK